MTASGRLARNKVVVTGGARDLGLAICERFVAEGATVAVVDLDGDVAEAAAASIGAGARGYGIDVTNERVVADGMAEILDDLEGLDVLVNGVGITHSGSTATETEPSVIERMFAVNVGGIRNVLGESLASLAESQGSVVNLVSVAALRPYSGAVWYSASQAAIISLTHGLAAELAAIPIRVNAVAVSLAKSERVAALLESDTEGQLERQMVSVVPLGRLAEGADVAGAVAYLASSEASFVTGAVLRVDGGTCVG